MPAGTRESLSTATLAALATALLMIAHQVSGKATRDGLFLRYFDVTDLPKVVMLAGLLSLLSVFGVSKLLTRYGPGVVVPFAFVVSACCFAGEWVLFDFYPRAAALVLYFHMATFGAVLISGFWSLASERFDPHTAKRAFARVAAACTLGGVIGGILTERVVALLGSHSMLLMLSAIHLLCALGAAFLQRGSASVRSSEPGEEPVGIANIVREPYLRRMAMVMALTAVVAALLDYALKAEASDHLAGGDSLTAFFAIFYAVTGLVTFAIQSLFGPQVLQRFGIAGTMSFLPGAVLVFGVLGTAVTHIWTVMVVRAVESCLSNSFFRSAFELLYTPLAPKRKRPTKTIIDVGSDRLGDMLGSGLLMALLLLVPDPPTSLIITIAMAASGLAMLVIVRLQDGYVHELACSLRGGAVSLSEEEVQDATTRHAFRENQAVSDREFLLARLDKRSKYVASALVTVAESGASTPPAAFGVEGKPLSPELLRLVEAISDLQSGDVQRVRAVLGGTFMDVALVPYMVPLLGESALVDEVRMELRWLAPRIIGQLSDILTDPDTPMEVRVRLPEVMEVCHSSKVVNGLLEGLTDGDFQVRYSCARALSRMLSRSDELKVSRRQVIEATQLELTARDIAEIELHDHPVPAKSKSPEERSPANEIQERLHHVFTVLGLAFDRAALEISWHALHSGDSNLRGTALEYLENVLPTRLRHLLWQRLGMRHTQQRSRRPLKEIVADLRGVTGHKPWNSGARRD